MLNRQVLVSDAFFLCRAREEIDDFRKHSVPDFSGFQKRVARGIKEPAVILRNPFLPTFVNEPAQILEARPVVTPQRGNFGAGIKFGMDFGGKRVQTIGSTVIRVFKRQQPAALGIKNKEEPIEQDEAIFVERL